MIARNYRQTLADYLLGCAGKVVRNVLRQQGNRCPWRVHDLAAIRFNLSAQNPQQRRLASSITAAQANPLA
jgi:hypothetical protein